MKDGSVSVRVQILVSKLGLKKHGTSPGDVCIIRDSLLS